MAIPSLPWPQACPEVYTEPAELVSKELGAGKEGWGLIFRFYGEKTSG
jgi:hypothetical protein